MRLHNRRIYNLCYRFTNSPDDAQDLTQEVFIRVYKSMGSYHIEKGAFTTWLTTLTRNLLVDHFRKSKQDRVTDSIDAGLREEDDSSLWATGWRTRGRTRTIGWPARRHRKWCRWRWQGSVRTCGKQ